MIMSAEEFGDIPVHEYNRINYQSTGNVTRVVSIPLARLGDLVGMTHHALLPGDATLRCFAVEMIDNDVNIKGNVLVHLKYTARM